MLLDRYFYCIYEFDSNYRVSIMTSFHRFTFLFTHILKQIYSMVVFFSELFLLRKTVVSFKPSQPLYDKEVLPQSVYRKTTL